MVVDWDALWVVWKAASMVDLRVVERGAKKAVSMVGSRAALSVPWMVEHSADKMVVDSVALWVDSKVASMVES